MLKRLSILLVIVLVGVQVTAAQTSQVDSCDPYGMGTTTPMFEPGDLTAPATGSSAVVMESIGINPDVFVEIADNIIEINSDEVEFAHPDSNLQPATSAIVTNDVDRLKVYEGICFETEVVGELWSGSRVTVLDGPFESEGFAWWRVRRNDLTGWVIEGSNEELWLQGL